MLRDTIKMSIFTDSSIKGISDKSETKHLKKFTDTLQTLCRFLSPLKFILVSFPP